MASLQIQNLILWKFLTYGCLFVGLTGQRFALREGGRTVGAGVVSKVIG